MLRFASLQRRRASSGQAGRLRCRSKGVIMNWTAPWQSARQTWSKMGFPGVLVKWGHRKYRAQFKREGYLYLPRFFSTAVCDRITQEAEQFYIRQGIPSTKADRTMNYHQE